MPSTVFRLASRAVSLIGSCRGPAAASVLLMLPVVMQGWRSGYEAPGAYLEFWSLNALAVAAAWLLLGAPSRPSSVSDFLLRLAIVSFSIVVGGGLLLGAAGWLTPGAFLALLAALVLAAFALVTPDPGVPALARNGLPRLHPVLVLLAPLLVLVLCAALAHPPIEYDSLTYHLFFPARWLQAHRMSIVPTPFGDPAPAYAPANGELFFLWLMLPFHGDLLARAGEFPFYGLLALTVYGLARQLGAARGHALYAGGFVLLSRPILEQAVGAEVDVVFTAMFLAAVYFSVAAVRSGRTSDIVLLGLSSGLCIGTKVLGVTYVPLLAPFFLARQVRRRILWVLPGIAALGLPWFLRNWMLTGTPLYPVSLAIGGITLAPGGWSRSVQTQNWAYQTDLSQLPLIIRDGAFGSRLLIASAPLALIGIFALVRARRWMWLGVTVGLPLVMTAVYWWVLPYNGPSAARFLFPVVGLTMLLVPAAFQAGSRLAPVLHAAAVFALVWLVAVGPDAFVPPDARPLYALLTALCAIFGLARRPAAWTLRGALLLSGACVGVLLVSGPRCPDTGCPLLDVRWTDRPRTFAAWEWVEQHVHDANIAYSGNNVPYRLLTPHFENGVYFVNVDRHAGWKYHDYERAARHAPGYTPPTRPNAPYYLAHPDFGAWRRNLTQMGIQDVFLTRLSPLMEDDYFRDEDGFPIEATWVATHPEDFTPVFDNRDVRIYAVRR